MYDLFWEEEWISILIIYADDLGYGDVQCYNPKSKIPNDRLPSSGPPIDRRAEGAPLHRSAKCGTFATCYELTTFDADGFDVTKRDGTTNTEISYLALDLDDAGIVDVDAGIRTKK